MNNLKIRSDGFRRIRDAAGLCLDKDLASALHVDPGTVSRVISGKSAPGPRFIAESLTILPAKFEDLFEIVSQQAAPEPKEQAAR